LLISLSCFFLHRQPLCILLLSSHRTSVYPPPFFTYNFSVSSFFLHRYILLLSSHRTSLYPPPFFTENLSVSSSFLYTDHLYMLLLSSKRALCILLNFSQITYMCPPPFFSEILSVSSSYLYREPLCILLLSSQRNSVYPIFCIYCCTLLSPPTICSLFILPSLFLP